MVVRLRLFSVASGLVLGALLPGSHRVPFRVLLHLRVNYARPMRPHSHSPLRRQSGRLARGNRVPLQPGGEAAHGEFIDQRGRTRPEW